MNSKFEYLARFDTAEELAVFCDKVKNIAKLEAELKVLGETHLIYVGDSADDKAKDVALIAELEAEVKLANKSAKDWQDMYDVRGEKLRRCRAERDALKQRITRPASPHERRCETMSAGLQCPSVLRPGATRCDECLAAREAARAKGGAR